MRYTPRDFVSLAFLASASVLAACQGNIGGGSGLSIPQAPGYQQPGGPAGSTTQSRQRLLDGAVYLSPKLTAVPLPVVGGYGVSIALGTPGPVTGAASPEASSSASALSAAAHALKAKAAKSAARAGAMAKTSLAVDPTESPSPDGSAPAVAAVSASPASSAEGSAAPKSPAPKSASSSPSAEEPASPSADASASPTAKGSHAPAPATTGTALPRFETKTIVDPDDAPPPPTPMPTGEVQTFIKRSAIIRGYVLSGADLPLYGLGAVRFTMPASEITPKRGFTIALFESGKHHHDKLMTYDNDPLIADGIVYSSMTTPLVLKKGSGYLLLIYGDDELAPPTTPASVPPGYPGPGNNPFPVGSGNPQPSYSQVPGYPPGTYPTPNGQQTPYPILTTKPT